MVNIIKQMEIGGKDVLRIDHFTLYDFSQFRPCDVLQAICLLSFKNYAYVIFMHVNSRAIGHNLKETVLWGTVIWSEKGKQNIQEEG